MDHRSLLEHRVHGFTTAMQAKRSMHQSLRVKFSAGITEKRTSTGRVEKVWIQGFQGYEKDDTRRRVMGSRLTLTKTVVPIALSALSNAILVYEACF